MCGIFGYITTEDKKSSYGNGKYERFLEWYYTTGILRGEDGSGGFLVGFDNSVQLQKAAIPGSFFVDTPMYQRLTVGIGTSGVVGHVRKATRGSHTFRNTHPFNHGHIHLVHNGSLTNLAPLPKSTFGTDSEAIAYALSVESPEEVIPKLRGAFALVWYNSQERAYYMVRNDERPLAFIVDEDKKNLLFGSEGRHLSWLADRAGFTFQNVKYLNEGILMRIPIEDFKGITTTKVKLYEPPPYKPANTTYNTSLGYWSGGRFHYFADDKDPKKNGTGNNSKVKPLLDELGLNKGDLIYFWAGPTDFVPGKKGKGKLEGVADYGVPINSKYKVGDIDAVGIQVRKRTVTDDSYYFCGHVHGASLKGTESGNRVIIYLNKVRAVEYGSPLPPKYDWSEDIDDGELIDEDGGLVGPGGELVTVKKFKELVGDGCANCSCPITEEDSGKLSFIDTYGGGVLCEDCGPLYNRKPDK